MSIFHKRCLSFTLMVMLIVTNIQRVGQNSYINFRVLARHEIRTRLITMFFQEFSLIHSFENLE